MLTPPFSVARSRFLAAAGCSFDSLGSSPASGPRIVTARWYIQVGSEDSRLTIWNWFSASPARHPFGFFVLTRQ
jgi:hypothetical protein